MLSTLIEVNVMLSNSHLRVSKLSKSMPASSHKRAAQLMETLSTNMKKLREMNDMSQEELAEKAGVHRTYISMIECCDRNVTLSTLQMLADALNVSVPALLKKHNKN